jgi:hypothetical protein
MAKKSKTSSNLLQAAQGLMEHLHQQGLSSQRKAQALLKMLSPNTSSAQQPDSTLSANVEPPKQA